MIAFVLAVALVAPSASQKWVALVHVTGDVPATWQKELQQAAEQNKSGSSWAPPPQVTLDEAQLALGCAGWNHACQGQIANMSGAGFALVVDVAPNDKGGVTVKTQGVKANGNGVGNEDTLELVGKTDKDLEFAKDFVKNGARGARSAYLVVESDIPATDIFVDDDKKGVGKWAGMLSPGEHHLRLSTEGHATVQKTVTLKAGFETTESVPMTASGPPVETTTSVGTGLPHTSTSTATDDHEVKTQALTPDNATTPSAGASTTTTGGQPALVGWSLAGGGAVLAVAAGVLGGAAIYDRFYNRETCVIDGKQTQCFPVAPALLGFYPVNNRQAFFNDANAWIGGTVAAFGVGVLLVGTGVVLAMNGGSDVTQTSAVAPGE